MKTGIKNAFAFVFGGLFALGLLISGMANPQKVLNFLDIFGQWDRRLLFVMLGAIAVAIVPFQKAVRSNHPKTVFGDTIALPNTRNIDLALLVGSALFGMGWGIAGICPAPSLALIGLGNFDVFYFVIPMLVGMALHKFWQTLGAKA